MARNFGDFISSSVLPPEVDTFSLIGYVPTERQKTFHEASKGKVHAILYGGSAGGGKLLTVTESIPTPNGWTPMGDIHVGDEVFGPDGKPYKVISESEPKFAPGYRFTFDDGSSVISNDEHLWLTYDAKELGALTRLDPEWRARRQTRRPSRAGSKKSAKFTETISERNANREYAYKEAPAGTVRTTAEIVATLKTERGRSNHAIPVCSPLQMPERDLPIDPYVLGTWLGDGSATAPVITTMDGETVDAMESAGYPMSSMQSREGNKACTYYFRGGLVSALRSLGLLGDKHIPYSYLWASEAQRLALLQGLMDTDGNCLASGTVEFVNTNKDLTEGVAFLARSLGHKVNIREGRARFQGRNYGPTWKVKFRAKVQVFRLARKASRLEPLLGKERRTTNFRYIISAERTEAEWMKCIGIDSPDHLYLATENLIPTHNTAALLMDALYNAANYPGMRIGCVRRTYPELEESFIAQLQKWRFAQDLGARWNATKRMLSFPNGSVVNFVYAENAQDATRIQGSEYQAWYFDEGGLMNPDVIGHLEERLRSGNKLIPVIGLRISSNPGGPSHKYLKDRFVTPTNRGKLKRFMEKVPGTEKTRAIAFIPAKVSDNPHVNEDYQTILDGIADPQRRAAMRDGDWDAMVGQFFASWSHDRHVVPSFPIPAEWQRYAGIDYGFANEWAVIWVAPDNDGRLWGYREIYAAGVLPANQAKIILESEVAGGEHSVIRVADPSMWGSRGTPMTIADEYGIEGCGIYKADNDRISGWARCHQFLDEGPACEYHRSLGWEKCPMFHVFEDKCPNFIETIPTLPRDPARPEDALKGPGDHLADAWRYVCMAVGTHARPVFHEDEDRPYISPASGEPSMAPRPPANPFFGGDLRMNSSLEERY